jgi:DNA polymerase elongation subunit (family B)
MRGNIPIPELPFNEEVWLTVSVTSVRQGRTQQGKPFRDVRARNSTGTLTLKIWAEALEGHDEVRPGLWGITGKRETFQNQTQFVVSQYRPITIEKYREHQNAEPVLPRAFTMDIETLALPGFRERVGPRLEKKLRLGNMRLEEQQRYVEDTAAEEDRVYRRGSLEATTGRVLSIAVHVGPIPGLTIQGLTQPQTEYVFGIDADGNEQTEARLLTDFVSLLSDFDVECDEIVGHNIIGFDLPFIFQRCRVHNIAVRPFVNLGEYNVRGVFDTMRVWCCGDRRGRAALDDIAWTLGIESSKTEDVEGSRIFELYHAGKLAEIREYNLNDVRVTRKVYERMVACSGR